MAERPATNHDLIVVLLFVTVMVIAVLFDSCVRHQRIEQKLAPCVER